MSTHSECYRRVHGVSKRQRQRQFEILLYHLTPEGTNMKLIPLSLAIFVNILLIGCAVTKSDSSSLPSNMHATEQEAHDSSAPVLNPPEAIESEDIHSDIPQQHSETQSDNTDFLYNSANDEEQSTEIIYPNKAYASLKEPWTLKQFEENVASNHIIEWDFSDSDEENMGKILLYKTHKNNDGKVYLIAREHGDNCNLQAYLYLGIRDYKDDQLVVNFYQLGSVLVSSQCGTTYREMTDISMDPPNKVIYQEQTYLKIDISFTRSEELYCAHDDLYTYEYDENGDYILDENGEPKYEYTGCEAIYKDIHYKTTYLYKINLP